jgi:S1-C subfamily serine protease
VNVIGPSQGASPAGRIIGGIVTNVASTGGSSGGPLVNMQGQVIGMLEASDLTTQCCSYAIPSNSISHILASLIETGVYDHPYHDLHVISLSADPIAREKIPRNIQGVLVKHY